MPLLLLLVALGSCASAGGQSNPFAAATGKTKIRLTVRNENFYDATIWAVVNGARQQKLGVVPGKNNASFTMAWKVAQPLQFDIDLLTGNQACRTRSMMVDPGDDLELQIMPDLGQTRGCS